MTQTRAASTEKEQVPENAPRTDWGDEKVYQSRTSNRAAEVASVRQGRGVRRRGAVSAQSVGAAYKQQGNVSNVSNSC